MLLLHGRGRLQGKHVLLGLRLQLIFQLFLFCHLILHIQVENYLDSIIKKICESGKMSLSIELEEDLSQEDLEYIKKGVEDWYERYL